MGVTSSIEARTRELLLTQRILDLKQKKRERDIQQSMQVAATRDRLLWVGGYYTLMGLLAGARHLAGHRRGVKFTWDTFFLPLNQAVVCLPPILFGYQLDYALFDKVCSPWRRVDKTHPNSRTSTRCRTAVRRGSASHRRPNACVTALRIDGSIATGCP